MQNKKIKTEIIMLPVPAELFLEAGMFEGDPMQMYADGQKLYKHRDPIRIFRSSDAPTRSSGMTFSDGNTIEKETMLGDRALNYLYALADRYYEAAESSADTSPDTATS